MEKVTVKINGNDYQVDSNKTVLEACHDVGIDIPTLCWMREKNNIGACRMCVVEVKGARALVASCVNPVGEGMEIVTNSKTVLDARRTNLELLLSTHDQNCLSCARSTNCELQDLCYKYSVDGMKYMGKRPFYKLDDSTLHLVRDDNKCVLCRRCVAACHEQFVEVITPIDRGFETHIGCAFEGSLGDTPCISCGQCIAACPTGALVEKDDTGRVWAALADPDKTVVVQTAPAIRAGLGEAFDMPMGTNVEGKMAAALRQIGFDKVFDTDTGADFTIVEEATEFMKRLTEGGTLPLLTSCCPGWAKFCETYHSDLLDHISSCKSPQSMLGALVKTYWAQKEGIDPKDIVMVSVMPCTAKKFEIERDDLDASGYPDNDISITTRELSRMIKRAGLDFANLEDENFDEALGESTGAATIFGATGGVLEAALRTAADWITGEDLKKIDYDAIRGPEGIKEATYKIGDKEVSVCSVSGMSCVEKIIQSVKDGTSNYDIIEIMACPGGCVTGGGQPNVKASVSNFNDVKAIRASALYNEDAAKTIRKSHQSPLVQKVYEDYFDGEYGCEKAHEVLHTSYAARKFKYS